MSSPVSAAERLRTLREMNGWTQADLASASGVSQAQISSIEKLRREATPEVLEKIADATGAPRSFFSVAPSDAPSDSLHFRKNKTAPIRLTNQVKAFFREGHRVSSALLEGIAFPVGHLPAADARASVVGQEDIEEISKAARQALGIDEQAAIPNLTRALERAGSAVFRMSLPGVEEGSVVGKGHFGISYWGGPGERPVIGYFSGSGDRDRFTIAHEVGHVVLHAFRAPGDEAESEAHRFAGALLLPRERAEELITARTSLDEYGRIKATFGLSMQASIMRGFALGLIDDGRKKSLMIQLSQRGWRTTEPVRVPHENPMLLGKALVAQWPEKPYLSASQALGVHPQVLRSLAPTPSKSTSEARGDGRVLSLGSRLHG